MITPNAVAAKIPSPVMVLRPSLLNLHKSEHAVPSNIPTFPEAPGGAPVRGGEAAGGGGTGGGSRLNGLSPWPYGAMPSGGLGLRGSLVGCANAGAVGLSSVERAHCDERFGEEAAHAPRLDGIDPAKRAGFDRTALKQEREREDRGSMPVGTTPGAQGFGGLGGSPH